MIPNFVRIVKVFLRPVIKSLQLEAGSARHGRRNSGSADKLGFIGLFTNDLSVGEGL